eukprot:CAMPEP_0174938488 /NCGR_PEP_ID=MMETSP1355-20121228/63652_1 /TAXON_ID=464990 /ORGANISM="Hemiselmis tepida, Strain CCMP443" /LENGTH=117 /DNA_ID=CAMNT_0016185419 /DNA_START=134 /DNA_END=484 /DNA_ORIENTATION=+
MERMTLAEYWGVESRDAREVMGEDPAAEAGRREPKQVRTKPEWHSTVEGNRLMDPDLSTTAFSTDNFKATHEHLWGLRITPKKGQGGAGAGSPGQKAPPRPIYPSAAITPAAARALG